MIGGAPELKGRVSVSLYLIVTMLVAAFSLGGVITKVLDNDTQRQEQKEFLLEEIQGLRSDWERQYNQVIDPRLKDLEDEVKKIK